MNFYEKMAAELAELNTTGAMRRLRTLECDGVQAVQDGRTMVNFSGNDYLGVAGDAALRRKFRELTAGRDLHYSAASSRLLTGNSPEYTELEAELAAFYGHNKATLVFNSGYHANVGILPALSGKDDLILSDKLNHASIIDGMRLCEAEFRRYRHLNYDHLESMLRKGATENRRMFIVSESVFSMDGDAVDLAALIDLKARYGAFLIVDEAHSVGVYGPRGVGMTGALANGLEGGVDIMIGTFGKAFGSAGAYAVMDKVVRDYLINRMRTLIFTTGLPPVELAWSSFILREMAGFDERRANLRRLGDQLRGIIRAKNYQTCGESQIVPLTVGENQAAVDLADKLCRNGALVFPIRPPTVPPGTARLRFSLNAAMSAKDVQLIGEIL